MKRTLISLNTIARKEVIRILRIWPQTLLPSPMTMSLYLVVFGRLVGSRIPPIEGVAYIDFIVPGLIMMAVITNSYSNVVSSFFSSRFHGNIEELLISPTPNSIVIIGYVAGGMARGLLVGIVVTLVAMCFTTLRITNSACLIFFIVLTSFVFSLGGLLNGILAKTFDDISIIPTFVITPLTYLGGVFYSVNVLGFPWNVVSMFNPILYMVNGFRFGFFGVTDVDIVLGMVGLIAVATGLFSLNLYLLNKGVRLKS
ncbi:MAG: ABC transporter permease [Gemmataceae bacterium]